MNLVCPNGGELQLLGEARVNVQIGNDQCVVTLPVISKLKKSLLVGRDILLTWEIYRNAYKRLEDAINKATTRIKNTRYQLEVLAIEVESPKEFAKKICEKIAVSQLSELKTASEVYYMIKVQNETLIRQKPWPIPYHQHQEYIQLSRSRMDCMNLQVFSNLRRR